MAEDTIYRDGDTEMRILRKILARLDQLAGGGAGVSSAIGTPGQIVVSGATGAVTFSLPTDITGVNSVTAQPSHDLVLSAGTGSNSVFLRPSDSAAHGPTVFRVSPESAFPPIGGSNSGGVLSMTPAAAGNPAMVLVTYRNGFVSQPFYLFAASEGTEMSPATTGANGTIGGIRGYAYANGAWRIVGGVTAQTSSTFGDADFSGRVQYQSTDAAGGLRGMIVLFGKTGNVVLSNTNTAPAENGVSKFQISPATSYSQVAWGTAGAFMAVVPPAVITDTSSSGTVASAVANSFAVPTFATTSVATFTDATNVYIAGDVAAGTNTTITNRWGLWNVGKTRLDGLLQVTTVNAPLLTSLTLAGGSSGSSLVLGSSSTAGAAILTVTGTGRFSVVGTSNTGFVNTISNVNTSPSLTGLIFRGDNASVGTARNWAFVMNDAAYGDFSIKTSVALGGDPTSGTVRMSISNAGIISISGGLSLTGGAPGLAINTTVSSAAWGLNGVFLRIVAATGTDTSSSGTVASVVGTSIGRILLVASAVTTYTDAATLYVSNNALASTNVTITNAWGIWNAGNERIDGFLKVTATTDASALGTASVVALGGLSVAQSKATRLGGDLYIYGGNAAAAGRLTANGAAGGLYHDTFGVSTNQRFFVTDGSSNSVLALTLLNGTLATESVLISSTLDASVLGTAGLVLNSGLSVAKKSIFGDNILQTINGNALVTVASTATSDNSAAIALIRSTTGSARTWRLNVGDVSTDEFSIIDSTAGQKRFSINASGNTTFSGSVTSKGGALGYETGAGGTIAQSGSRTAGVTLNKVCGAITTDTTSLAGGSVATFTVTNSTVAIGDIIELNTRSGATNLKTVCRVTRVAAGAFDISVINFDSLTAEVGAIVINFSVFKAVTS